MRNYKGIEFAKGYNKSFAEFKEEFGSNHIFNAIHPSEREQELKKAFKIATEKEQSKVNEIEVKSETENGKSSTTSNQSEETPAE